MLVYDPYYDVKGVSNSSLRYINPIEGGSPALFKQHWDGDGPVLKTSSLEFGNLLHLAVLEPHLLKYVVDESNTPDKVRDILKDMHKTILESNNLAAVVMGEEEPVGPLESYLYAIIEACDRNKYGAKTWKEETKVNKIISTGSAYWDLLRNTEQFIITQNQKDLMDSCMQSIKKSKKAVQLFFAEDTKDIVYHNELEVHWTDDKYSFPLKAKIDRIAINKAKGTFRIIDLKTTSKTLGQFKESFDKYNYARQMAFYTTAAEQWLKQNISSDPYTALSPIICAVETKGSNRPGIFILSDTTWNEGRIQAEALLNRLDHHFTNNTWNDDMETDLNEDYYI